MAIQHHPLSNAALGEYINYYHIPKHGGAITQFDTVFVYREGLVTLKGNWTYETTMHVKEDLTAGTNDNPSSNADTHAIFEQILDTTISNLPREQSSVSPALDKQSIDGMDSMGAFADSIRSEADEASTDAVWNESDGQGE